MIQRFYLAVFFVTLAIGQNWQCPITQGNVNNSKISSDFGPRNMSIDKWFHKGIDLGYSRGTPVFAVERGRAFYDGYSQNIVRIVHPYSFGIYTNIPSRYLHNDEHVFIPDTGLIVHRGDIIAYVGDAGSPGEIHLHFEFGLYGMLRYQPLSLLPYNNVNDPGPIEFINLTNGDTVSGLCTVKVTIYTTIDKDLNKAELLVNGQRVDLISYDPRINCPNPPRTTVEPVELGIDIFKFKWNTLNFPNGQYTLNVRAYDVRGRVGENSITVDVQNRRDVGVIQIHHPQSGSRIGLNNQIIPQATIMNFGTKQETTSVEFKIFKAGSVIYQSIIDGLIINPGQSIRREFGSWVPRDTGVYTAKCYTNLFHDEDHSNDTAYSVFTVASGGGGDDGDIRQREDLNNPSSPYMCNSYHPCGGCCLCAGRNSRCCACSENCNGCCACSGSNNCSGCCYCDGNVSLWPPSGWYVFFTTSTFKTCWHRKVGSPWNENSTPYALLDWDFMGGTVIESLISPIISLANCTTVVLRCSTYFKHLRNGYTAQLRGSINGGVSYSYLIKNYAGTNFGPGCETFNISSWAKGQPRVRFVWTYTGGVDRIDFWALDNIVVFGLPGFQHDIAINEIRSPKGLIPYNTQIIPRTIVHNFGKDWETTMVYCRIEGIYTDSVQIALQPARSAIVSFKQWIASLGSYTIKAYSTLVRDEYKLNDTVVSSFRVVADTWVVKERALANVKSGGALTSTDKYIYALTGYPNMAFLRYLPEDNQWRRMKSPPKDADGGADLVWAGQNYLYALEGGASRRFYNYNMNRDTWIPLANTPQNISQGGSLVWCGSDYLYALKGGGNRSFYRYRISTNRWDSLSPTPDRIGKGGALTWDGSKFIYALRGRNERSFYRYNIENNTWTSLTFTPNNVGLSARLTCDTINKQIYAFRGGWSNEFWRYNSINNSWDSRTSTPQVVGSGGALAFYKGSIYGLRGDYKRDFWNYALPVSNSGKQNQPLPEGDTPIVENNSENMDFVDCAEPVFSPDGNWICYQKYDTTSCFELYKISVEGEESQISEEMLNYKNPQWSPDGEWILCTGDEGIYKVQSDGTESELLIDGFTNNPQWSPDGDLIIYTKWDGAHKLFLAATDGSFEEQLTYDNCDIRFPQWTPDGNWILYQKLLNNYYQLCKMSMITGQEVILTNNITDNTNPYISADGREIVYEKVENDGYRQIYKISIDGGEEIRLTFEPCDHESPKFSPDGIYIAYVKWQSDTDSGVSNNTQICYVPATGGTETQITDDDGIKEKLNWSPDCELIVYEKTVDNNKAVIYSKQIGLVQTNLTYKKNPDSRRQSSVIFSLDQNKPNPFKSLTVIRYSLPVKGKVSLAIYDVSGRIVKTLVNQHQTSGIYSVNWNGTDDYERKVGQGVYFYVLKTDEEKMQKKMLMLR